ncbi:transmembrane protein 35B [Phascolarctos cinereus]|uniref:Transmembrane protein 35B n=1 Tax=Phascolarctos cinereus TaxID=38626 RepID=A0A6P5K2B5_PHACI|nr:transmembrane protein 35B [Phascolarctos cinereus]
MGIILWGLRVLLGIFFMLTGVIKISGHHVPAHVYAQMKVQMLKFAGVLPLKALVDHNTDPENLLIILGWVELVAGFLLVMGPPLLQEFGGILLSLLMIGTIYSLVLLKESVVTCAPSTLCLGILLLLVTHICNVF